MAKGIEADACYYVQNASKVVVRKELDLEIDPPPDIALEIDMTRDSTKKLSIYVALRVPEVWRYDGEKLLMYELSAQGYTGIASSRSLPGLNGTVIADFIELSQESGQTPALQEFLAWLSRF